MLVWSNFWQLFFRKTVKILNNITQLTQIALNMPKNVINSVDFNVRSRNKLFKIRIQKSFVNQKYAYIMALISNFNILWFRLDTYNPIFNIQIDWNALNMHMCLIGDGDLNVTSRNKPFKIRHLKISL